MRMKQMMLVSLGCLLLWTTAAVATEHHNHSHKVGKEGQITLAQPTKVGDKVMLLPNTYVVQHRTSGDNHFVRFVELKKAQAWSTEWNDIYTEPDSAGEVKCRIEPAAAPIKETMVSIVHEKGGDRMTQVAIKGEDVVHMF